MPGVTRKGDMVITGHLCTTIAPTAVPTNPNVFCNMRLVCRQTDMVVPHTILVGKFCVPHTARIIGGNQTVRTVGLATSRIRTPADLGFVITGSFNVLTGSVGGGATPLGPGF